MASGGTGLGLMVAAAGAWSAGWAGFALRRATRELPPGPRRRWLLTGIPLTYATASVAGFCAGYALSSGPAGRRLGLGFVGVALGWLLLWFLVVAVLSVRAAWATAHYAERVRPISLPDDQVR